MAINTQNITSYLFYYILLLYALEVIYMYYICMMCYGAPLPNSVFNDVPLIASSQSWWEYLNHGNLSYFH